MGTKGISRNSIKIMISGISRNASNLNSTKVCRGTKGETTFSATMSQADKTEMVHKTRSVIVLCIRDKVLSGILRVVEIKVKRPMGLHSVVGCKDKDQTWKLEGLPRMVECNGGAGFCRRPAGGMLS
ncbi:hypothetical protein MTR_2g084650 [Medicago truncatula]|uniref:Uncharacterized protein n=1 Tax=Medicago truncatula TaxID=3880 RepID=A0A072VLC3_MEDTR|nr:hypothetical protein MTR_2g084650 [Medicago truncatula]